MLPGTPTLSNTTPRLLHRSGAHHTITSVDTAAYLQRINYRGPLTSTAETLRQLHLAHLLTVPFENLSIHRGEPIVLSDDALFEKIVRRKRGGFCYELNGLFAALLRSLGFDVTMLAADVANDKGEFGPPFDHMTLLVTLEERWLADVGFGDSFREPLLLDEREPQIQGNDAFKIEETETHFIMSRRDENGDWHPQYRFTLVPYGYADYDEMCRFHQTSPESHFTQKRICSRATKDGRVSLSEMRLITTSGRERKEVELTNKSEYADTLREKFGITIEI